MGRSAGGSKGGKYSHSRQGGRGENETSLECKQQHRGLRKRKGKVFTHNERAASGVISVNKGGGGDASLRWHLGIIDLGKNQTKFRLQQGLVRELPSSWKQEVKKRHLGRTERENGEGCQASIGKGTSLLCYLSRVRIAHRP